MRYAGDSTGVARPPGGAAHECAQAKNWSVFRVGARLGAWASRRPSLVAVLIGIVAFVTAWLRLPGLARDTLWAEDGRNFLQNALDLGPLNSLFVPYAGYLHTLPRIVASVTVQVVPVQFYAQAMTAGACALAGIMAAIIFVCSSEVLRWLPARVVVAMLTVLAPLAPREVLGNAANLHSLVLWTLFWMLLYRPRTRYGSYGLALFALLGSLTEIQALFLLPLLLWHLRDRSRLWLRAGYFLGVCIQLGVTLLWPRGQTGNPQVGPASIVYGFFINCVVPLWIPQKTIGPAMAWGGMALCLLLFVPFVVALLVGIRFGSSVQRVAALSLFGGAIIVYWASVYENPQSFYGYASLSAQGLNSLWLARYGVVPSMMLCALIPLAAAAIMERPRQRRRSIETRRMAVSGATVILVLLLMVQFVPQSTRRSFGPAWQPQIVSARSDCSHLSESAVVRVRETIGWRVDIPCERLG